MFCPYCVNKIAKPIDVCPNCHIDFIPKTQPLDSIEVTLEQKYINMYQDRILIVNDTKKQSYIAHGGGFVGAMMVGALVALGNHEIEKYNGIEYVILPSQITSVKLSKGLMKTDVTLYLTYSKPIGYLGRSHFPSKLSFTFRKLDEANKLMSALSKCYSIR